MINITRSECPSILQGSPLEPVLYGHIQVVEALWEMQNGKCCYCEQDLPVEGHHKNVEHFKPKSTFPKLINHWENLLLSCAHCNNKKSNKFPTLDGIPLVIDPSNLEIHPKEHISFLLDESDDNLGLIITKNNSQYGENTIAVVGLYRKYYTRKRKKFFFDLMDEYILLLRVHELGNSSQIDRSKRMFEMYMSDNNPFAAFAREFVLYKKINEKFDIDVPQ